MRTAFFGAATGLFCLLLGGAPAGCSAGRPASAAAVESLVVLHTNDVHSHLEPFEAKSGERVGGVAARDALIRRQRALGGRVLLLDGGDLVQGTPYYNRFRGEPDHRLLDLLGYDAIALGNHDLDDGFEAWRGRAAVTRTPILSANVFTTSVGIAAGAPRGGVPAAVTRNAKWVGGGKVAPGTELHLLAAPYVIFERGGLRIAVLGLTTPSLDRIVASRKNQGVAVGSPVAAANYYVPKLRREADVVIALTHIGVDQDRWLVDHVPGLDLVIGGHSHTALFRPIREKAEGGRGTPIAQAGAWGRYLGRTTLRWSGDRARTVDGRLLEIRPAEGETPEVEALLAGYRSRLGEEFDRVVFRTDKRVESSALDEGDAPLGNFVSDVLRERADADLAVMNAGGIRSPLPAGDVRVRDIVTMLPFDNRIVVVTMTGAEVQRLLDRIARHLGKSGFGHVSGASYVIRRDRATEVRVWKRGVAKGAGAASHRSRDGDPLDANRRYRVATIDFLSDGGDYFDELRDAATKERTEILLSDAAIEFLRSHPAYRFGKDGRVQWRGTGEALRDMGMR
ncbi:MAG TPA: bifunctional UDP-sugar hydrolase/5'-nucleotidase [Candidatus Eisenbacteria bacterium]|nr:bifunctional UDP-sugar hydrolase/5'-nucleotidase [Candidatus Eisenbacteria bacterium]